MIKPEYYKNGDIDVIEFARIVIGIETAKAFCRINIIKYVTRYDKKNGVEDLNKALTYLYRLLELEGETDESENKNFLP